MDGALTFREGTFVKCRYSNLSTSLPERTPQKSAAKVRSSVVRLMTNSPVRAITSCEYLSGRIDTETITGSLQIVPAQAAVIMLLRPSSSAQLIITAGTGYSILEGRQYSLAIKFNQSIKNISAYSGIS
jgi:hypothetical protein